MIIEEAVQYLPVQRNGWTHDAHPMLDWILHHLPCLIIHSKWHIWIRWIIVVCNVNPLVPAEVPPHLTIIHLKNFMLGEKWGKKQALKIL